MPQRWAPGFLVAVLALSLLASEAGATSSVTIAISEPQADALRQLVVVAIQQNLSALPPSAGQSFLYEWDPALDTYASSTFLGPVSFRTPDTIGRGRFSVRGAASYFSLDETFDPIEYRFAPKSGGESVFARIGLRARADIGVFVSSLTYGLSDRIDVTAAMPVTLVDVSAQQSFTTRPDLDSDYFGAVGQEALDADLHSGQLVYKHRTLRAMGADFDDGTKLGLGRSSLSAKIALSPEERIRLAFLPEVLFPSPSEDELSGTGTFAVVPRFVAAAPIVDRRFQAYLDAAYSYDFDVSQLRSFVWSAGASAAWHGWTVDAGVGGAQYDSGVHWSAQAGDTPEPAATDFSALADTDVGDTFVDFLFGVRAEIAPGWVVAGAASVPLNDEGVRPEAAGTLALEAYF